MQHIFVAFFLHGFIWFICNGHAVRLHFSDLRWMLLIMSIGQFVWRSVSQFLFIFILCFCFFFHIISKLIAFEALLSDATIDQQYPSKCIELQRKCHWFKIHIIFLCNHKVKFIEIMLCFIWFLLHIVQMSVSDVKLVERKKCELFDKSAQSSFLIC